MQSAVLEINYAIGREEIFPDAIGNILTKRTVRINSRTDEKSIMIHELLLRIIEEHENHG